MVRIVTQPHVFGATEPLPLVGAPEFAKIRLRLRSDDWAMAFVKIGPQISRHFLIEKDGAWHLSHSRGLNIKIA